MESAILRVEKFGASQTFKCRILNSKTSYSLQLLVEAELEAQTTLEMAIPMKETLMELVIMAEILMGPMAILEELLF